MVIFHSYVSLPEAPCHTNPFQGVTSTAAEYPGPLVDRGHGREGLLAKIASHQGTFQVPSGKLT